MDSLKWILGILFALAMPLSCSLGGESTPGVGDKFVDVQLNGLDGKAVKTAELRKDKVFILKFGATWCPPCNAQIPVLNKVNKEYAGKVAILDVDVKEAADKVREHNKKHGTTYTTVLDSEGKVATRYNVSGIPVVIVADKDGKVAYRGFYTTFEAMKKVIDKLLEAKS